MVEFISLQRLVAVLVGGLVAGYFGLNCASAQTIYPLDRADILAGSKFDLKVEFPGSPAASAIKVTVKPRSGVADR